MKAAAGIFLIIMGFVMLIKPNVMWKIAESWKTKTNGEPTDVYMIIVRIGGLILAVGGVIVILVN